MVNKIDKTILECHNATHKQCSECKYKSECRELKIKKDLDALNIYVELFTPDTFYKYNDRICCSFSGTDFEIDEKISSKIGQKLNFLYEWLQEE